MGRPSLRSPRLWLLLAVSGAYLAAHVVRAARWRYLLAHLTDCGYWPPLHALTLGVTANNLLPVKAGLVARIHLLSRRTQLSHATVGSSMLVEALFDGVILLALAAVALALVDLEGSVRTGALIALAVLWLDGRRRQREQPRQRGQQPRRSRVLRLLPHPARAAEAYAARRYRRAA